MSFLGCWGIIKLALGQNSFLGTSGCFLYNLIQVFAGCGSNGDRKAGQKGYY